MLVLAVNAGSTSVKLRLVGDSDEIVGSADAGAVDEDLPGVVKSLVSAHRPDVIGHRIVHGGPHFTRATTIDSRSERELAALADLAPLHNAPALAAVDAVRAILPDCPAVACFDTTFHMTLPEVARTYAIPAPWRDGPGIRRYGFHGLSHAWASRRAAVLLDRPATDLRLVTCHLGGGASLAAVHGGRSVDTTMGFTPLSGLVMATRPGDVDPGALVWLVRRGGVDAGELDDALEHRSGLLGLSETTGDMRELLRRRADGDDRAALAVGVYLHRLRAQVAAMAAAMGGIDGLVFTGGVGEASAPIRAETCSGLEFLGVGLDGGANNGAAAGEDAEISASGAAVRTLVVHAREDLEIARQCRSVLA